MKTKVRVKRAELIKVVDGRARKAENEHKRALAAYPEKLETWQATCVAKIEKALTDAKAGKIKQPEYGDTRITLPPRPARPSEGKALCNLRRMLATLNMGADDTLMLSQEDADDYFGPCTL